MSKRKRYCIQKLDYQDKEKKLTVWKNTRKCSDSIEALKDFCTKGKCRIFDRDNGEVVYEP